MTDKPNHTCPHIDMTTIEQLIDTIMQLKGVAERALELVDEYGCELEASEELRDELQLILDNHHAND